MRLFDLRTSLVIVLLCLPLLFIPKINLMTFDGETAGLRMDDLILLGFALILFWAHFGLRKKLFDIEWWVLILTVFSLFSFGLNRIFVGLGWLQVDAKIFYCVRILEYFLFFYVGAMASRFTYFSTKNIIWAFFLWNVAFILMQKFGLIGTWTSWGYSTNSSYRTAGISSFPSEMGALLNLIFCYLIFDKTQNPRIAHLLPSGLRKFMALSYTYTMFLICSIFVIFTGSRIAIVALILPFLAKLKEEVNFRKISTLIIAIPLFAGAAVLLTLLIQNTYSVVERSVGLLSMSNIDLVYEVWDNIALDVDPVGHESVALGDQDVSWWIRIHKWCHALKIYVIHPECWLQGVGPGFATGALDGGFLRVLTEYGIIGSYIYFKLFQVIWRQNQQLKWVVIAFLFNMIFFDAYLAYKPMVLIFFMSGSAYARKLREEEMNTNKLVHEYAI